jgi:polyisoprenoid-binding protein YceI
VKTLHGYFFAVFLSLLTAVPTFAADTYVIDAVHSNIGFSIKHLTVSDVQGNFKTFSGSITLDAKDPTATQLEATIETKSINTQNEARDAHLRNADFFDADANPTITFKSTAVTSKGNTLTVAGELMIKGVTKPISLTLTISGPIKSPMSGDNVIGISGQTKINRQDFGVKWNKQMDQGGYILGDEVAVSINLEAHKKLDTK